MLDDAQRPGDAGALAGVLHRRAHPRAAAAARGAGGPGERRCDRPAGGQPQLRQHEERAVQDLREVSNSRRHS